MARARGWRVVMRVEDLDTPRVKVGAAEATVRTLEWLGMDFDGPALVQSADLTAYQGAMQRLAGAGLAYPCELTRGQIEAAASAPQETHDGRGGDGTTGESVFPAELRPAGLGPRGFDAAAQDTRGNWRFATPEGVVSFTDAFAGPQRVEPARTIGDFVIWTKRGCPSYQLAVVVDDARAQVTEVVRGNDLIESAARQMLLYGALGLGPVPRYWHLPLVRGPDGKRLAKRHGDTRVDTYRDLGVPPERVIGLCAFWCGLVAARRAMDPGEFVAAFEVDGSGRSAIDTIPRSDVVFSAEDDAWLRSG